jgi:GT2 family glycosyltransferase
MNRLILKFLRPSVNSPASSEIAADQTSDQTPDRTPDLTSHLTSHIGAVVIGRNEGDRLIRCLAALQRYTQTIVYVDSGSTDGSAAAARDRGVAVVDLDLSVPFTAARARNAGFEALRSRYPELRYVQFLDGDCEVVPGWLAAAAAALAADPDRVAVCGWRRERYPERSPYNQICDVEWHMGPVGDITQFGGDVMVRAAALAAVGGYNAAVVAAEDDELSVRLRRSGGHLHRIDHDSTLHDANITRLSQWWQRAKRCGYAYAQVRSLHGAPPERKFVREVRRSLLWGAVVPLGAVALAWPTQGWSLLVLARYPVAALRTVLATRRQGKPWASSIPWGLSCGVSAFPEAAGIGKFYADRLFQKPAQIIEYKGPTPDQG